MSTSTLPPTAPTTLAILLGASAWPHSPGLQPSQAFVHAAQGFKYYVLDRQGFGLPTANLLDLFDAPLSASDQLELLGSFLEQRAQALKAVNQAKRDVVVYFVGHGGFAGSSADFYLLPHRANASSLRASGIAIDALAEVLRERARQMRRYLFLDCCFAAAAFRSFQGGPDQTAIMKTLNAFHVQARSSGFPGKGTVLLCSSDQKSPSLLLPDESSTMFSSALLDVLRNGDLHRPPQLSLRDLKELAEGRLAALPEKNAPRPGLYSPDQSEGDAADVPFFPNPRAQVAIPPQHWATLPHPPTPKQPKRLRTPLVVALISLILLLLAGGSLGIYGAATGNWPWKAFFPAGRVTEFSVLTANSHPAGITAGPDGNLWFTENKGNKIGRISPSGTMITEFPVLTASSGLVEITAGPDGNLWFTEYQGNKIGRISPSGTMITEFSVLTANSHPIGIAAGPDGNLWFTETVGDKIRKIGRISPSGKITEFALPAANSIPSGIVAGPDGNLWFTGLDGNQIGRISPSGSGMINEFPVPTASSELVEIAAGPDGNLWFTEYQGNKIGRISPSGTIITEFSVLTANSHPAGITAGPDGNLWFTEADGNQIGRITSGK